MRKVKGEAYKNVATTDALSDPALTKTRHLNISSLFLMLQSRPEPRIFCDVVIRVGLNCATIAIADQGTIVVEQVEPDREELHDFSSVVLVREENPLLSLPHVGCASTVQVT